MIYEFSIDAKKVDEMKKSYEELKEIFKNKAKLKVAFGYDQEGKIIKAVVVDDPKEYERAQRILNYGRNVAKYQALHDVDDRKRVLQDISNILLQANIGQGNEDSENMEVMEQENKQVVSVNADNKESESMENMEKNNVAVAEQEGEDMERVENPMKNHAADRIIYEKGDVNVCARVLVETATKMVQGVSIYLADAKTNMPFVNGSRGVIIRKNSLLDATDHSVMAPLKNFDLEFTEDDQKKIYERCRSWLDDNAKKVHVGGMRIDKVYRLLVDEAPKRDNGNNKVLWTREELKAQLDDLGGQYNTCSLINSLKVLEEHLGVKLIANSPGRNTWSTTENNETVRYYRFNIVDLPMLTGGQER